MPSIRVKSVKAMALKYAVNLSKDQGANQVAVHVNSKEATGSENDL